MRTQPLHDLPGGVRTADGTVFLADCLTSRETLDKYGITFLWDVGASLETLERVREMKAACFVPAHAPVTDDVAPLAEANIAAIRSTAERILAFLSEPSDFETLLARVFTDFGLTMNAQQYVLIGSTVRSYLSWLSGMGQAGFSFENNRMLWHAV